MTCNLIAPREYQLEAIESIVKQQMDGKTRQLISLPTGCGKTVVFAMLAKELNTRTIVVAHTEELITQAVSKFKMIWPDVNIGIVKAVSDEIEAQVVVASIQTATKDKRLQRLKEQNFSLMIIDEAHHAAAPSYENVVHELGFFSDDQSKLLLGVTATPQRSDGVGLGKIFQEVVFERSISTMIRAGYLSQLVGKQVFTKVELASVGMRGGDFIPSELARMVDTPERNQLIVDNYKLYAGDRKKALAFCVDVQHAKDLAETFNKNGIAASAIYGAMDSEERKKILADFSDGKYQVLSNCQLLTEGFDEPSIDCVVMGRPTQSAALFIQMIGRGTRTFPLKRDCLVLDFTDNASKHDLCTYRNILGGAVIPLFDKESEREESTATEEKIVEFSTFNAIRVSKERTQDIEFFDKAQFAWTASGNDWHLCLSSDKKVCVRKVEGGFLVLAKDTDEVIRLCTRPLNLDYALGVAEDWARKQPIKSEWARKDAEWRSAAATETQINTLRRLGIDFESGISKGLASQLIGSKFNEPATSKQIYWLRYHGMSPLPGITKIEAKKMIASMMAKSA